MAEGRDLEGDPLPRPAAFRDGSRPAGLFRDLSTLRSTNAPERQLTR